jgi:hypothetical protein
VKNIQIIYIWKFESCKFEGFHESKYLIKFVPETDIRVPHFAYVAAKTVEMGKQARITERNPFTDRLYDVHVL